MNMEKDKLEELKLLSAKIRKDVLEMLEKRGYGHMGGSLSIVELMSVLYGKQLRYDAKNPDWEERDMVVLSKGHSGPAWYSVLAEKGFFDREWLFTLNDGGTKLPSHPDRLKTPGVDMTTGSLGQGTSAAAGIATGFKMNKTDQYVYLIVGDGELNEGQCWEAFQYIAHYKLNHCVVIIDDNKKQLDGTTKEVMNPFSIENKMKAFGFYTQTVKGNDEEAIDEAINRAKNVKDQAVCIILDSIKGAGVPYFEQLDANHSVKFNNDTIKKATKDAIKELDEFIKGGADLGGASGFTKIKKTNPERFIQCGIAEANMMGVAAGLSLTGFKPFTHTFAPFATRRVFDQLFLSGAYAGNTINVYGSDPGFSVASNGGTHTAWEDVALIREIPGAVICDPADDVQMEWIIKEFLKMEGIHYVRSNRKAVRNVYKKGSSFKIGQGNILKEGKDILIIAAGQLVSEALDCAEELEKEGYSVEVIDMFTIKPLDEKLLIKEAKGKSKIVTIENHSIYGGLGSAVSEVIAENGISVPVKRIGVKEKFGQVGTAEFLQEEFGLTAKQIKETICQF